MNEHLQRLDGLLDDWIAHPEKRPPKLKQPAPERPAKTRPARKPYALPAGTEVGDDGIVTIPGTERGSAWHVNLSNWTCDCPAYKRWPPCKHVDAVKKMAGVT